MPTSGGNLTFLTFNSAYSVIVLPVFSRLFHILIFSWFLNWLKHTHVHARFLDSLNSSISTTYTSPLKVLTTPYFQILPLLPSLSVNLEFTVFTKFELLLEETTPFSALHHNDFFIKKKKKVVFRDPKSTPVDVPRQQCRP